MNDLAPPIDQSVPREAPGSRGPSRPAGRDGGPFSQSGLPPFKYTFFTAPEPFANRPNVEDERSWTSNRSSPVFLDKIRKKG